MSECVKCGFENENGVPACGRCTWPFTKEQWKQTSFKIQTLTIDTGCINAKGQDPNLNKLEEWEKKGYLRIQRAPVLLKELKGQKRFNKAANIDQHPGLFRLGSSTLGGGDVLAGPNMPETLRWILFPTVKHLHTKQQNDVEHLRAHVQVGGDVFVTNNPSDFINNSKQEQLSNIGIWVFQPAGLVSFLSEIYGWS